MNRKPFFITIEQLARRGTKDIPSEAVTTNHLVYSSPATLSYNSPGAQGFGVKRAGLAIPESVEIVVSPACCGRNSTIEGAEAGFAEKIFFLRMDETDLVTGRHLTKIPDAVREVVDFYKPRPKVVVLCVTCADALLGTDMERVCRRAEAENPGIRVIPTYMYALTRESIKPPMVAVRRSIYSLLERKKTITDYQLPITNCGVPRQNIRGQALRTALEEKQNTNDERRTTNSEEQTRTVGNLLATGNRREPNVLPSKFRSRTERSDSNDEQQIANRKSQIANLLGFFAPLDDTTELYGILGSLGFGKINEISRCKTFEEYKTLADAQLNIVLHPEANMAAEDLRQKLGTGYVELKRLYQADKIHRQYELFAAALGKSIDDSRYYDVARERVHKFREKFTGATFSFGQTLNGEPFEMALAFARYGFKVDAIFANLNEGSYPYIQQLAQVSPKTKLYLPASPTMLNFKVGSVKSDFSVGRDVSYYLPESRNVAWNRERQPFGFDGLIKLLDALEIAAKEVA